MENQQDNIKISTLTLDNYRGFKNLKLSFDRHLTVLAGVNGSGKSSVLDSCALILSWLVNRMQSARSSGRPIPETCIANGANFAMIQVIFSAFENNFAGRLARIRKFSGSIPKQNSDLGRFQELAGIIISSNMSETSMGLPIFAYYPVDRAVLDIPLRIRTKHEYTQYSGYDNALVGTGANFRSFFEWFRNREDLENELFRHRQNGKHIYDYQLQAVREALEALLPEFKNLTIRRDPLRMEVEKNGMPFRIEQLSDGEKCFIALVGDIARRMAILSNEKRSKEKGFSPLKGNGIVLIDEIDLHLHPAWQRIVVPRLTQIFPNVQFIVSTHSPSVLTQVKSEQILLLKFDISGNQVEEPQYSYGKTVDRILEDVMGLETTRPDEVKNMLNQIFNHIACNRFTEARKIMTDLRKILDDPNDEDLVLAEAVIRRKEIIGK